MNMKTEGFTNIRTITSGRGSRFYKMIEGKTSQFTASDGCLDRYKKELEHDRWLCVRSLSADISTVEHFKPQLFDSLEKEIIITADKLYNCDETESNYKFLPLKTLPTTKKGTSK